jgi:hypothetical protein
MPGPPERRTGPGTTAPTPPLQVPTPISTTEMLPDLGGGYCRRCVCCCCRHRPPPEPPYVWIPPRPGSWEWSGYLAELSAELGSLEAAYAAVDPRGVAA